MMNMQNKFYKNTQMLEKISSLYYSVCKNKSVFDLPYKYTFLFIIFMIKNKKIILNSKFIK
jgi:hypothetical protein